MNNKVFVCGGGHQGLSMAAYLSLNGVNVSLYNRSYKNIKKIIDSKTIKCDGIIEGEATINKISSEIEDVYFDFVMVTVPANAHKEIAKRLAPFVNKNSIIILNPGRTFGAIEFALTLKECGVKELPHIAETQTILFACRRSGENKATIFALKNNVSIASLASSDIDYILDNMPKCILERFRPVESTAITSLSNVGGIIHCAPILMNIGWIETPKYQFRYYYDGITKSIAGFLEKLDKERIEVANKLGFNVLSVIDWMKTTYGVEGDSIYDCIKNNKAYEKINAPQSINGRYIEEDLPCGLVPVEYVGQELGVMTPNTSIVIDLANSVMNCDYRALGRRLSVEIIKYYI